MLQKQLDLKFITEVTGLSEDEVLKIKQQMKE